MFLMCMMYIIFYYLKVESIDEQTVLASDCANIHIQYKRLKIVLF